MFQKPGAEVTPDASNLAKHGGRNGWVGLLGTDRSAGQDTAAQLLKHTEQCLATGALAMASSWAAPS